MKQLSALKRLNDKPFVVILMNRAAIMDGCVIVRSVNCVFLLNHTTNGTCIIDCAEPNHEMKRSTNYNWFGA